MSDSPEKVYYGVRPLLNQFSDDLKEATTTVMMGLNTKLPNKSRQGENRKTHSTLTYEARVNATEEEFNPWTTDKHREMTQKNLNKSR